MRRHFICFLLVLPIFCFSQADSITIIEKEPAKKKMTGDGEEMKVFYSQKLINANTVEVLRKGILEFRVSHGFGDVGGDNGGVKRFFGLDNAADVRIGLQLGLSNKLNLITARAKGASPVQQLYELGLKYQFLQQSQDNAQPISLTAFVNTVISTMTANGTPDQENSFEDFSDRTSEVVQVMLARRFKNISFQLSPTYVTRGYVVNGDDKSLFAIGAGLRIPLTKKLIFIGDYFHTFRSQESKDIFADPSRGSLKFYDAIGAGFEILTQGHVFHVNFTNATELLENRFIPRTVTSWGKGQFRWSFTMSRNFTVFRDKKNK
jgi:hypothetical protein